MIVNFGFLLHRSFPENIPVYAINEKIILVQVRNGGKFFGFQVIGIQCQVKWGHRLWERERERDPTPRRKKEKGPAPYTIWMGLGRLLVLQDRRERSRDILHISHINHSSHVYSLSFTPDT